LISTAPPPARATAEDLVFSVVSKPAEDLETRRRIAIALGIVIVVVVAVARTAPARAPRRTTPVFLLVVVALVVVVARAVVVVVVVVIMMSFKSKIPLLQPSARTELNSLRVEIPSG